LKAGSPAPAATGAARKRPLQALFRSLEKFVEIGRLAAPPRSAAIAVTAAGRPRRLAPRTAHGTLAAAFTGIVLPGHSLSFSPLKGVLI
jgi:hypothetical protein